MERVKLSHAEQAEAEAAVEAVMHKEDLGAGHVAEGHSVYVQGGPDHVEESGDSWVGDGILKTVDLEQTAVSVPERAMLPSERVGVALPMNSP